MADVAGMRVAGAVLPGQLVLLAHLRQVVGAAAADGLARMPVPQFRRK